MHIVDVKQFVTSADGTRRYAWTTITATSALRLAEPRLRCPECKGAIGLYRKSEDGAMPDRGEHRKRNHGCSLGDCFDGVRRMAASPIEADEQSIAAQP